MPRSASRIFSVALCIAMPLSSSCIYGTSSRQVKSRKLDLGPPTTSVVAKRFDVEMRDGALWKTQTQMCADMRVGTYTVTEEERAEHKGRARSIPYLIGGVGSLVGSYFAIGSTVESLSYLLIPVGVTYTILGLVYLLAPGTRSTELPPDTLPAATFSGRDWTPCGEPEPVTYPLRIVFSGGGDTFTMMSEGESTFTIPADVAAWAGACNVDVSMSASAPYDSGIFGSPEYLLMSRSDRAMPSDARSEFPELRDAETHAELGSASGAVDGVYTGQSWTFQIPPSNREPAGDTAAADFARKCLRDRKAAGDKVMADKREACRAPKREEVRNKCRPECVFPEKTVRCDTALEICLEQTQGIDGPISESCRSTHASCVADVGQSPSAISSCMDTCMERALSKVCP